MALKLDSQLTEKQFVKKYVDQFGATPEVEDYLHIRYQWMQGKATFMQTREAWNKTHLPELEKENLKTTSINY